MNMLGLLKDYGTEGNKYDINKSLFWIIKIGRTAFLFQDDQLFPLTPMFFVTLGTVKPYPLHLGSWFGPSVLSY